jgi:hypothetical protein
MSERQGFWSARPRPGHDDAALLAIEHLHALRQLTRHELRERADGDWRDEEVAGLSGQRYRRRTRVLNAPDEAMHIRILADDGTRAGALRPLAEEIVHVTPDGQFLREHTLASSSSERRRYEFPTRWYPLAMRIVCVAMIVVFLLKT